MRILTLALAIPVAIVTANPAAPIRAADLVLSTSNDSVGDGEDRWRSGAAQASVVFDADEASTLLGTWGGGFTGDAAWEIRVRGEVITPDRDASPFAQDRLFADTLGIGLLMHERLGPWRGQIGGELAITGEQTGVRATQEFIHEITGLNNSYTLRGDRRIDSGFYPTGLVEGAYVASVWGIDAVPFVSGMVGVETLGRAGFDLHLGADGLERGWVRNTVTGIAIPLAPTRDGWHIAFTGGGDFAVLAESEYFDDGTLPDAETVRFRARLGTLISYNTTAFGLGLSYLSAENEDAGPNSDEGQFVGAVTLTTQF